MHEKIKKTKEPFKWIYLGLFFLAFSVYVGLFILLANFAFDSYSTAPIASVPEGGCVGSYTQVFTGAFETDGKPIAHCVPHSRAWIDAVSKLGPVGDSFAVLNSIFGIMTFVALLLTLLIQKEQLKRQIEDSDVQQRSLEKQLADQRLRYTEQQANQAAERKEWQDHNAELLRATTKQVQDRRLFDWIDLHHRMVERVVLKIGKSGEYGEWDGVRGVNHLYEVILFETAYWILNRSDPTFKEPTPVRPTIPQQVHLGLTDSARTSPEKFRQAIQEKFDEHRLRHDGELGHLFRNAYRLLKWVDSDVGPEEVSREYAGTFRDQLSFGELSLILLNCHTEETGKALPLFMKYKMFENIPDNHVLSMAYLQAPAVPRAES
ncbi:MAG: putative phage abortive infection protein [Burkholderiales bacterium]